ncbi:MAG: DUF4159 domain-containing protein [Fidelibacterota bacterium]|nr:MAG: DUF4159 domain-containing protein [Candidatus Neomarinimicrobiota bacterium]
MTSRPESRNGQYSGLIYSGLAACLIITLIPAPGLGQTGPGALTITRLHYGGGGDWYADPSSLSNLIAYTRKQTGIRIAPEEARAAIGDDTFWGSTYLYITGHGNIHFTDEEAVLLRSHLIAGAFLHADDNYGIDHAFKREMKKVFPDKDWVELPPDHPIFNIVFPFPEGLPKIHEHDGKRPQGLGLFQEGRLIVFYTYECDLGDGWEDPQVHDVVPQLREAALKMGANIITYALCR